MVYRKSVLITGANGLLGKHLLPMLIMNYKVHALVHKLPSEMNSEVVYHPVDFSKEWSYDFLPEKVDIIIHMAQSRHFRDFPRLAMDVFKVNIDSTARLLEYATKVGVKQFIYASSGGVYGNSDQAFHENAPIFASDNLGYYLGSKLCGEVLVNSYSALMRVVVLRFFFMYGANQGRDMLIPRLLDNIRDGVNISLQGDNGIRINPIHVGDAAHSVIAVLEKSGSATYNIAGSEVLSLKAIGEKMGKVVGKQPVFEFVGGNPSDLIGDNEIMMQQLHIPRVSFEDGIKDLL